MLEAIYEKSPVFIQNIMSSVYGLKLYRLRYKGIYSDTYKKIIEYQWLSNEELLMLQKKQLLALAKYASNNIDYYRHVTLPGDLSNMSLQEILNLFPVLTKKALRDGQDSFLSSGVDKKSLLRIATSGTTGTPLTVYTNVDALQKNYAYFSRFLDWAGCNIKDKSITFAGRTIVPPGQVGAPFWRMNPAMNNTLFSSYHLSENNMEQYIRKMEDISPIFIDSYPSAIYSIAEYILRNNIKHGISPKAIITSSETLFEHQRQTIEKSFNCKVYDQYGSAEMSAFISQCEKGSYHVNSDYCIVEVLDENDDPVKLGELGRLVSTGFINDKIMPLVRYDIGDTVSLETQACPCGRQMPVIRTILGRTDSLIRTPDGRVVGRLDPVFKGLSGIKETQIAQTATNICELRIVKDVDFTDASIEKLKSQLQLRLGLEMQLKIRYLAEIPRTSNGKFISVISEI